MYITWYGQACFKFLTKYNDADVSLLTDPFENTSKQKLSRVNADIVTVSMSNKDAANVSAIKGSNEENPFVISSPGEFEVKGLFVTGIMGEDNSVFYRYDVEGVSFLFIGDFKGKSINEKALESIGVIDVLMLPLEHKDPEALINQIEPRLIMPVSYEESRDISKSDCDTLANRLGAQVMEVKSKWRLVKKDLPQDETSVVCMTLT